MKICVTGASGYIASKLLPELLKEHEVNAVDLDQLDLKHNRLTFYKGDIRDLVLMDKAIKDVDTVIHLAAVVPPHPTLESQTEDINYVGACKLAVFARVKGVKRFLMASTCSVYGTGDNLTEWAVPQIGLTSHAPNTPYVSSKIKFENYLLSLRSDVFNPVIFRFSTVFGYAPKIGWQSLFNSLVKEAIENGELLIRFPNAYRPFCHIDDIAQGIKIVLKLPIENSSGKVYNIGGINVTKIKLAELIKEQMPDVNIKDLGGKDLGYSVNFDLIHDLGFKLTKDLQCGIRELLEVL
ncbi:MAG: NAD(P)-dependent oxidoreductase [Lutibacter sp.]|jgi:nucleoside-diphosphate-sugar epimerase